MHLILICTPNYAEASDSKLGSLPTSFDLLHIPQTSSGCISSPYPLPGCIGNMLIYTFSKFDDSKGDKKLIPLFGDDCADHLMPAGVQDC